MLNGEVCGGVNGENEYKSGANNFKGQVLCTFLMVCMWTKVLGGVHVNLNAVMHMWMQD